MKINNKGWGTAEISLALLLALIVAIYFISKLYGSFALSKSNKIYMDLEDKLASSARNFIKDSNIEINDRYQVSYAFLKQNGYINDLKDANNEECNGYVLINKLSNRPYYKSYITCQNYSTENITTH